MKKVVWGASFVLIALCVSAFAWRQTPVPTQAANDQIRWYTWEEAVAASARQPKKLFVDVYTDWCGYCKRMDASTFTDPAVIQYLNENFYPVKFNAEQTADIQYKGHTLKFQANGRRGYHELAAALLDDRLSYPSFVYLDENQLRITISPGYKTPDVLLREMRFVAGGHYKNMRFEQFQGK
jgi:thioredoxin-related protein